ncbi:hypothetical protein ABIF50_002785 [Bradyrhizobium diazoefficiens]
MTLFLMAEGTACVGDFDGLRTARDPVTERVGLTRMCGRDFLRIGKQLLHRLLIGGGQIRQRHFTTTFQVRAAEAGEPSDALDLQAIHASFLSYRTL